MHKDIVSATYVNFVLGKGQGKHKPRRSSANNYNWVGAHLLAVKLVAYILVPTSGMTDKPTEEEKAYLKQQ